jgi:hypothetical protein
MSGAGSDVRIISPGLHPPGLLAYGARFLSQRPRYTQMAIWIDQVDVLPVIEFFFPGSNLRMKYILTSPSLLPLKLAITQSSPL